MPKHDRASNTPSETSHNLSLQRLPLKISGVYFLMGVVWILIPDYMSAPTSQGLADLHTHLLSDWLFVVATTGTLYGLLHRVFRRIQRSEYSLKQHHQELQASEETARQRLRELQLSQKALHQSEERFRQMAEAIQEVFWLANAEFTQALYVNPAYEKVWGRSCASAYQQPRSFLDAIHPEDRERILAVSEQQRRQGWSHEYRIIQPSGAVRWIWERVFPISDASGQNYRVVGVSQDITDRKQAELALKQINQELEQRVAERTQELHQINEQLQAEIRERQSAELALRQSEELFRQIFDYAPIGIALASPPSYQFMMVNPVFCDMLGYTAAELMSASSCPSISHPDDLQQEKPLAQQLICGEIPGYEFVKRYIRKDEGVLWGRLKTRSVHNSAGELRYILGLVADITEQKQAEDALAERTAQLEETNRELESFSYSVSHDLRAPLRHISGFVDALSRRLEQTGCKVDPKVVHYLDRIQTSSEAMRRLINGLLSLSRVGRQPLTRHPVSLSELAKAAVAMSQREAVDRRIEFVIGNLPTVIGDSTLLQQVFSNLIENAVKFSRDRSHALIEIGALPDETVFVRDNGVGFSMQDADQLFGAFQRLHSQTEFAGTGIGLTIVQRIIHRHGGKIWADSQPDQGACFFFKIT